MVIEEGDPGNLEGCLARDDVANNKRPAAEQRDQQIEPTGWPALAPRYTPASPKKEIKTGRHTGIHNNKQCPEYHLQIHCGNWVFDAHERKVERERH